MILKFSFGNTIFTETVEKVVETSTVELPYGSLLSEFPFEWQYKMAEEDIVYGLGENMRGMNKRGFTYTSWCNDCPNQNESLKSMYGAHNFILIFGKETFGVYFDTPSKIVFDIDWTKQGILNVKTEDTGVDVYFIKSSLTSGSEVLKDIVRQFRALIGQSYIPPLWGFGFQQSRWGYRTDKDVRFVVNKYHKEHKIPLDAVCLDIDYMTDYEDFTVDSAKFADLKGLSSELLKEGVRLVPIIDAGVKVKDGYSVYDEGIKNNYFCTKQDGKTPYVAGVWPGRSVFTDFFNPKAREWFGAKYKVLTDQGIEGFWNDMNEPAMFYSDESLKETIDKMKSVEISNLDVNSFFEFTALAGSTSNRMDDYQRFYHNVKDTKGNDLCIRHDKVHNMFGANMTRAAAEALRKLFPDTRKLLYCRASSIGAHRYGGIWTGDSCAWWSHLEQEIKMLPSLNMCGFMYSGADIGGFGDDSSEDLVLRWTALGVFTPLMRNHSAWNTRNQECYSFDHPEYFKSILELRYSLIPYIYSEYVKCALNGDMFIRPLSFDYSDDKIALRNEDQLLVGEGIMIAPVYKQNADGRYVYLPEDMTMVTWKNGKAITENKSKGIYYIKIALDEVVFFVKKDCLVPLCKSALSTKELNTKELSYVGNGKYYELYEDDGFTRDIKMEGHLRKISL